ncbi:rRNA maturation RNase YbeY [Hathewaya histolytica]|uniref:Endoribonuclease YbeY n=1 Tax=Hathewaya histolytica TaxID=1498 RepID=A0A4U9RH47_HATHI|nr:rRNA maturation RNase YbeY [Hathewaya histolytica]VTQ90596.1 metalloprotease [Hathewaya histolytica]
MLLVDNRQNKLLIQEDIVELIEKMIHYTLQEEKVTLDYEISLILVDNKEIRDINRETRGKDSITDVLSFPMLEYPNHKVFKDVYKDYGFNDMDLDEGKLVLGDIALSLERAKEQSEEFNHSFKREVCYLIIHSILHLLGYDHIEDNDKEVMRKREEEILNSFNVIRDL